MGSFVRQVFINDTYVCSFNLFIQPSHTKDMGQIKIDGQYVTSMLEQMVRIDSRIGKEENLAYFLKDEVENLGFKSELHALENGRSNVYGSFEFGNGGKVMSFNGHLDTVDFSQDDPFVAKERDGWMYGLGVVDMKAGIACQLGAAKALIDSGETIEGTLHLTFVVDEEGHGKGAKLMMKHPVYGRPDGILIAEPFFGDETGRIPLGMTGKVLYRIIVKGKAAHAFRPNEGVNAITDAARIAEAISQIEATDDDFLGEFRIPKDENFGEGSFCVLKIEGGYKVYNVTVPEECVLIINRLTLPHETTESVLTDMRSMIDQLNLHSSVHVELVPPSYSPYIISRSHPLMESLVHSYAQVTGRTPVLSYDRMITDAHIFTGEYGVPSVVFGPRGLDLHGKDERVDIGTLKPVASVIAGTFLTFQRL